MKWICPECGLENTKDFTICYCGYEVEHIETETHTEPSKDGVINLPLIGLITPVSIILFSILVGQTYRGGTFLGYVLFLSPVWISIFIFFSISGLKQEGRKLVSILGIILNSLIICSVLFFFFAIFFSTNM